MFLNPNNSFQIEFYFFLLDLRNLQEQVKKAFCYQNFSDLSVFKDHKKFKNSQKFFSIKKQFFPQLARTILVTKYHFSQYRSEHFWKQNTRMLERKKASCHVLLLRCFSKMKTNSLLPARRYYYIKLKKSIPTIQRNDFCLKI